MAVRVLLAVQESSGDSHAASPAGTVHSGCTRFRFITAVNNLDRVLRTDRQDPERNGQNDTPGGNSNPSKP